MIEEFTTLLKNAHIQSSTLFESLNTLFHRPHPWSISRSDRPNSGGGDVVIDAPALTILATTTASLLKEYINERMIRSGFLNRYLVLPGSNTQWKFYDPEGAGMDTYRLKGLFDSIPFRAFGLGQNVWQAYTDDARERLIQFGEQTFEPLMNSPEVETEALGRLHMYSHLIALLYAWGEQESKATVEHVEASIAVAETAREFLGSLMRDGDEPDIPKFKSYEIGLEQKIVAKVQASPGITRRTVIQRIAGKKATSADVSGMIHKLLSVGRLVERQGEGNNPSRHLYRAEDAPRG